MASSNTPPPPLIPPHLSMRAAALPNFFTTSRPIKVVVGDEITAKPFHIHEALLVNQSKFFAAAMRKGWKENEEGVVSLPSCDPEEFAQFTSFLYTGQVQISQGTLEDPGLHRLAKAWLLGTWLSSITYQDLVLDALVHKIIGSGCDIFPTGLHTLVYSQTAGDCGVRRLLVDAAVFGWPAKKLAAMSQDHEGDDFGADVAKVYAGQKEQKNTRKQRKRAAPFRLDTCQYHEHGEKPCYKTFFEKLWRCASSVQDVTTSIL
ncbi:hypothetical protein LTR17_007069 [Elasticomyces elasticus]|nr:hypothetical protein LTR17_007069 [Elasticomyces elasticus]